MAVTKTIFKRRCPSTGSISRRTVFCLEEEKHIEENVLCDLLKSVILFLSPNGEDISTKAFADTSMSSLTKIMGPFNEEQQKRVRVFVKSMLAPTLIILEKIEAQSIYV